MVTRLTSLDDKRGFTIAAMILVNFPANDEQVFAPLRHTVWNGLTPTDLIAPWASLKFHPDNFILYLGLFTFAGYRLKGICTSPAEQYLYMVNDCSYSICALITSLGA
jgi:hypothetical protein